MAADSLRIYSVVEDVDWVLVGIRGEVAVKVDLLRCTFAARMSFAVALAGLQGHYIHFSGCSVSEAHTVLLEES